MRLSAWVVLSCWLTASVLGIEHLRAPFGTFQSPKYPNEYDNNLLKDWKITVRPGFRIKLMFPVFDLEDSYDEDIGPCIYDFVIVSDGSEVLGRYCGSRYYFHPDTPGDHQWIYSKNNTMGIHFETDYSNGDFIPTGFSAEYAETDIDECAIQREKVHSTTEDWDELITCNHFCTNTLGSYYCSCRQGFALHENGHTCFAKFCENKVLTGLKGDIESPDYPAPYGKLSNCSWDIKVRAGFSINLIFSQDFEIEAHAQGCLYDILTVWYKDKNETFCNKTVPHSGSIWDLNTNESRIEFTTDLSVEKMGFQLHYNTTRIKCLKHPRAPEHGSIPPNDKGFYEFEDTVPFSCNRGYEMNGESVLSCLSNGEWDFEEPYCTIKSCGKPQHLINVKHSSIKNFESKVFTYLETVTVVCDDWYEQRSGYATWRCEDSKLWTEDSGNIDGGANSTLPTCRPKCGRRLTDNDRTSVQVSGGKNVIREGGWPWMALVDISGISNNKDGSFYCGGTLIDEDTVLTAAHCIDSLDEHTNAEVWLGLRNRTADEFSYTQRFVVPFSRRFMYSGFNKIINNGNEHFDGDIAILKLGKAADLSYYVRPICLPDGALGEILITEYQQPRKNAIVTGWGMTPGDKLSDILMKVRLKIVPRRTCQENYREQFGNTIDITTNMFCAGYIAQGGRKVRDTCKADSGGPLMTKRGTAGAEKWYLSGIVSFGDERNGCGEGQTYGVYTDVSKYFDFIGQHTVQIV